VPRFFCFADVHGGALPDVSEPDLDGWLFAGDLYGRPTGNALFFAGRFAVETGEWIASRRKPVFAVRGNHDYKDAAGFFKRASEVTWGQVLPARTGLVVAGIGWHGDRFYDLPLEEHLSKYCARVEDECARLPAGTRVILLSHYPARLRGFLPDQYQGAGMAFDCVRALIEVTRPIAVVQGHVHESFGRTWNHAGCLVACPGPKGGVLAVDGGSAHFEPLEEPGHLSQAP
jgi:Icc-related predicted phosphoesterase